MNRNTSQEQVHDLLKQEITDDELKELIARLGEIDFIWCPKTTVQDVVEATSADPVTIGRLLANIRAEDWQARFGNRLDTVEKQVDSLQTERVHLVSEGQPSLGDVYRTTDQPREKADGLSSESAKALTKAIACVGAVLIAIVLLTVLLSADSHSGTTVYEPTYTPGR